MDLMEHPAVAKIIATKNALKKENEQLQADKEAREATNRQLSSQVGGANCRL